MALDERELYIAATGYILLADPGTEAPTNLEDFDFINGTAEWESVGHTARDELPEFGYDGGDTENRGTWQNAALRVVETEAPADYVSFNAHQFNSTLLSLYYRTDGGNTQGRFEVGGGASAFDGTRALLIVIVDGVNGPVGFHAPSADIRRNDSISLDTEEFAYLPLRASFLDTANTYRFAWISEHMGPITS